MALLIVFIAGSTFAGEHYSLIYYDGHMHSVRSDGSGTVAQIKQIAKSRGLDAVIITDHCRDLTLAEWRSLVAETRALSDSTLLMLPGFEVTGSDGIFNRAHVNALGVDDPFVGLDRCELCPEEVWQEPFNPAGTGPLYPDNITKWINYIHAYGGIAVHNHPSGTTSLDYGVDNLEIYNQGHVDDVASYAEMLGIPETVALGLGLTLNDFSLYGDRDLNMLVTLPGFGTMPLRLALYYATLSLPPNVGQWLGAPEAPPLNSWDDLLMAYVDHVVCKPIYGLANSDSHTTSNPADSTIGSARNGAFVSIGRYGLTAKELYKAIKAGHTFGTTGPSLELDVNSRIMGDTAFLRNGGTARINLYANSESPAAILVKIDIIRNGELWQTISPMSEDFAITLEDADLTEDGYYRVEVTSFDTADGMYKFAWSNPVFVRIFRIGG
jgi:hypothetical protein